MPINMAFGKFRSNLPKLNPVQSLFNQSVELRSFQSCSDRKAIQFHASSESNSIRLNTKMDAGLGVHLLVQFDENYSAFV